MAGKLQQYPLITFFTENDHVNNCLGAVQGEALQEFKRIQK